MNAPCPPDAPRDSTRLRWGVALVLAIATLAVYAPALDGEFLLYDDDVYVTANPPVRAGLTRDGVVWAFTQFHGGNWHPLTWLSHMADVELYGLAPRGHHATGVALHALSTVLLFFWLAGLTRSVWRSSVVAALFALHPLHVESVAWIAERKDVLSSAFGLAALLAWTGYVLGSGRAALARYVLALALFAASLLSKGMWVTLPCLLLLLDYWPLDRLRGGTVVLARRVAEKLPFFALSAAASAVTLAAQDQAVVNHLPLATRLANALTSYSGYLSKTIWPVELATMYPYPLAQPWTDVAAAGLVLGALVALAFAVRRRSRAPLFGLLWFGGTLVPVIGVVQVGLQGMADRYSYVPLIGIFVAVTWGLADATPRFPARRALFAAAAVVVLAACALGTRAQIAHWRDGRTLFAHALRVTEDNFFAHAALAIALREAGELDAALPHHREALRLNPNYQAAYTALGDTLLRRGESGEAIAVLERGLELNPDLRDARWLLGQAYEEAGRFSAAVAAYEQVLARHPGDVDALYRMALLRAAHPSAELRDADEALRLAERACAATDYASSRELDLLAIALANAGRFDEAIAMARRALELARAEGDRGSAGYIERRLRGYEAGRPYRAALPERR